MKTTKEAMQAVLAGGVKLDKRKVLKLDKTEVIVFKPKTFGAKPETETQPSV